VFLFIVMSKKLAGTVAATGTLTVVEPTTEPDVALTVAVPNSIATDMPDALIIRSCRR
jgi:hypothetical protein